MITSADNPRIKAYAKLKKRRERNRTGQFLIEGEREVARALAAGVEIEVLLFAPELATADPPSHPETLEVGTAPMRKVSIRENPGPLIAVAKQPDTSLERLDLGDNPLVLIADAVEKPGNLGAMMRTCDAVGADAMVVADPTTDVVNPNVVRASQGALFSVPVGVAAAPEAIAWCRQNHLTIVAGYPDATTDLWDVPLVGPTAVLIGTEDQGISPAWDGEAVPARIPMAGAADSLNASVTAALILFEAARQRRR